MIDLVLKFHFVWISASVLDQTLIINHRLCFPKCCKNDVQLFFWKNMRKVCLIRKFTVEYVRMDIYSKWMETIGFCSTSSRRKPGWRITAGSTYGNSWIRKQERANTKWYDTTQIWSSWQGFARWPSRKHKENPVERTWKINIDVIKM